MQNKKPNAAVSIIDQLALDEDTDIDFDPPKAEIVLRPAIFTDVEEADVESTPSPQSR